TLSGIVPAHAAEVAVPEPTSSSVIELPSAPDVETLTATITGTTEVGETLIAQSNAPEGSGFERLRDGAVIGAAANASTYQLSTDDVCTRIAVRVTPPSDSPAAPVTSEQT